MDSKQDRNSILKLARTVGGTLSGQYDGLDEGDLVGNFGGQDLFIGYSYGGEFTGVLLYTNAVPEPTTMLIWSMLAGLGMTVRRRR
ncbi:MAG: PEP-CTERM sorting domain-containing protein [Mariniblastus sp.]|nr:PEP-CTERM sorting domain-containing protein [Mariniblastus sp.]